MTDKYVYIAVAVSFFVNLIIIIAFRASDRKTNNFKIVQTKFKEFRSEVSSTMARMNSTVHDCEQNISSRIEHASSVQEQLAESIDLVLVHQRELDELSGVCENYGNALKKLKVQTEQAENRLYAVQAEVRKIEAVHEYAAQFQKETERLMQQMNSLKADYVRLVASTEQDLKAASMNQKEENSQMLSLFSQSIDRAKVQLSDYMAQEKTAYDDICRQEEAAAEKRLETLSEKLAEIDSAVKEKEDSLGAFVSDIKAEIDTLSLRKDAVIREYEEKSSELESNRNAAILSYENKRDALFSEIESRVAASSEDLRAAGVTAQTSLEAKIREKADETEAFTDSCFERIDRTRKEIDDDIEKKRNLVALSLDEYSRKAEEKEQEFEESLGVKKEEINALLESYSRKMEDEEKNVQEKIARMKDESASVIASFREDLDALRSQYQEDVEKAEADRDGIVEACTQDLMARKEELEEKIGALDRKRSEIEAGFAKAVDENRASFAQDVKNLEDSQKQYRQRCLTALEDVVEKTQNDGIQILGRIRAQGEDFLKTVAKATGDSEKTYHILTETMHGKVREAEESLEDLRNKIRETEALLSEQMENLTKVKEEIWNLQKEEKSLENDVNSLREDRDKLQSEKAQAKNERLSEEANLVRIKGQQKAFLDEKRSARPHRKIFEDMEDIVTGEEVEVDVSDDDEM